MRVIQVTPDKLEQAWPHALPWLEKADVRGGSRYPLEDTLHDIERCKKLLFKCVDGEHFVWLVLGCVENSQNRTAVVYEIAGNGLMHMLKDVVEFCEAYGIINNAQRITEHGRAGWVRQLAQFGWREISRSCGKEL